MRVSSAVDLLTPSRGGTTSEVSAQEQDMNAPPKIDPVTAHPDSDVLHWLTNDAREERFIDNIIAELCIRLQRAGIPLKRTINENDYYQGPPALEHPAQSAAIVVTTEGDAVARAVAAHPEGLTLVDVVCSTGQPCARIYVAK